MLVIQVGVARLMMQKDKGRGQVNDVRLGNKTQCDQN